VRASLAMVCMIFIVHTISGNQSLLKMTWPGAYCQRHVYTLARHTKKH
jgi:hypothetical protein